MIDIETGKNAEQIREVLRAIRRITQAVDIQSKQVTKAVGLTVPQLVILQAIRDKGPITSRLLAEEASLSPATLVTILDKLEAKGLVERRRDSRDRRVVYARLTAAGETALAGAPPLLHAAFSTRFAALPPEKQREIIAALGTVAEMLGASRYDAAPVLDSAPL